MPWGEHDSGGRRRWGPSTNIHTHILILIASSVLVKRSTLEYQESVNTSRKHGRYAHIHPIEIVVLWYINFTNFCQPSTLCIVEPKNNHRGSPGNKARHVQYCHRQVYILKQSWTNIVFAFSFRSVVCNKIWSHINSTHSFVCFPMCTGWILRTLHCQSEGVY